MNVLKPHLKATIKTLLEKGISQWEINQKTGIDRKTIRKYGRTYKLLPWPEDDHSKSPSRIVVATGSVNHLSQNPPPRPPALQVKTAKHARSACEPHRDWIEEQEG